MTARDNKGRFLPRLGAPLTPADLPASTGIELLPEQDDLETDWGTRTVSAGLCFDFDAAVIVDAMTRAHLAHTRQAIIDGKRPDGGGDQKELRPRAASEPDRQSPHRGYKSGELADGLRRTRIKSNGATASSRVLPPASRTVYAATEKQRGVNLLTGAGAAGEAAAEGGRQAIDALLTGRKVQTKPGEIDAEEASK